MTTRRPPPGRPRSQEKHQAIIDAAIELAKERPVRTISIEAVAAKAGVGKQTIYRWWPSKIELFVEVYDNITPAMGLKADTGSVHDDMLFLLISLMRYYRETPAGRILVGLISEAEISDDARELLRSKLFNMRAHVLRDPVRRGIARGELPRETDVVFVGDAIIGQVWRKLVLEPDTMNDAFAKWLVTRLLGKKRD